MLSRPQRVILRLQFNWVLDKGRHALSWAHSEQSSQEAKMILIQLLLRPSNWVCDHLGLTEQHERGMMRMFVNMCIFSGLCVVVFFALWTMLA